LPGQLLPQSRSGHAGGFLLRVLTARLGDDPTRLQLSECTGATRGNAEEAFHFACREENRVNNKIWKFLFSAFSVKVKSSNLRNAISSNYYLQYTLSTVYII